MSTYSPTNNPNLASIAQDVAELDAEQTKMNNLVKNSAGITPSITQAPIATPQPFTDVVAQSFGITGFVADTTKFDYTYISNG